MRKGLLGPKIQEYAYPVAAPLVALALLALALSLGVFNGLENLTVNYRFQQRAPYDKPADPRIALIAIDQFSLEQLGAWPWKRSMHGDLCQLLGAANAAVVGFDILFTEKGDTAEDSNLGTAAGQLNAVVTGAFYGDPSGSAVIPKPDRDWGKTQPLTQIDGNIAQIPGTDTYHLPIPPLRQTSYFAFVNCGPSPVDGIRRKVPLLARVGTDIFPSLSLQLLCRYWNLSPDQVHVHLGRDIELTTPEGVKTIPINEHGELLINYRNNAIFQSKQLSYADLAGRLTEHFTKDAPLPANYSQLDNKIFLIGQTEVGLSDIGPNPLNAESPLVLVHMNAMNNILQGDYLREASTLPVVLLWLLMSWATLLYLRKKTIFFSVLVPLVTICAYLAYAQIVFNRNNLLVPVVWPIALFTLLHAGMQLLRWLEEQKSRQQIKGIFASYIAPSILDRLLEHPESIQLGGVRKPVTTLFSDIRGFSSLSENMGEVELVKQLNEYFEKMVDCVNLYQGTLHKYIGDAIMAAWGDVLPEKPEVDAARAIRASLAMRAELVKLNQLWAEQKRPQLRIGIGLNHGNVLVGNIGAPQRREFTLIGDAVNLASRLEGVTKEYHTDLAIGESVEELVHGQFLVRTLGVIVVKGKTKPVKVYEVLEDLEKPLGQWPKEWVAAYEKAMEFFFAKKFTAARDGFKACLKQRPEDYCSKLYLEISEDLIAHPPGKNWDGTQVMKTK